MFLFGGHCAWQVTGPGQSILDNLFFCFVIHSLGPTGGSVPRKINKWPRGDRLDDHAFLTWAPERPQNMRPAQIVPSVGRSFWVTHRHKQPW